MRALLLVLVISLLGAPARSTPPDPYAGASETRELKVGQTVDYRPPGVVVQLICDHVGKLISVTATGQVLHITGLAPGVTACSIHGVRDRDDAPDGGHSGALDYRILVKFQVLPRERPPRRHQVPRPAP